MQLHQERTWTHPLRAWRVAMTGDGRRVVLASYGAIQAWDLERDVMLWEHPLPDPKTIASSLAISPDGQTLAISMGREIVLVALETGQQLRTIAQGATSASRLYFSPDGARLFLARGAIAPGARVGTIDVVDVARDEVVLALRGAKRFQSLQLSADGAKLWATGDKSLWGFELSSGALLCRYPFATYGATSVALCEDGESAWVGQVGPALTRLRLGKKTKKVLASAPMASQECLAIDPQGRWLLVVAQPGLALHDPHTGASLTQAALTGKRQRIDDLAASADGTRALTAHLDGVFTLWRIESA